VGSFEEFEYASLALARDFRAARAAALAFSVHAMLVSFAVMLFYHFVVAYTPNTGIASDRN
jgi:hypothetical protein